MDKKKKRILAILAVILLLAAFALPMAAAFGTGENARNHFIAALGVAVFVPVFLYICMMAVRIWGRKNVKDTGKIKNVIFDVGNVLVGFDWKSILGSYGFPEEKFEKIADATFRNDFWNERDRGAHEESWYVDQFAAKCPEYEEDIREIMRRSPECVYPLDYAKTWVEYLKKQGYHLYILSNYSHYMLNANRKDMKFLPYMDGTVFSCDVKMIKPEEGIFQELLKRYSLVPEECVFVDDKLENCQAAEKLGIHTVHFRDFKQAAGELEQILQLS